MPRKWLTSDLIIALWFSTLQLPFNELSYRGLRSIEHCTPIVPTCRFASHESETILFDCAVPDYVVWLQLSSHVPMYGLVLWWFCWAPLTGKDQIQQSPHHILSPELSAPVPMLCRIVRLWCYSVPISHCIVAVAFLPLSKCSGIFTFVHGSGKLSSNRVSAITFAVRERKWCSFLLKQVYFKVEHPSGCDAGTWQWDAAGMRL